MNSRYISFKDYQSEWDTLARIDPFWAILSQPERKGHKTNPEEFFQTGEAEVKRILAEAQTLSLPKTKDRLLDFGCGVGRLTRAFAPRFKECIGVDISEAMIEKAETLNARIDNLKFVVNTKPDLRMFDDQLFDMIYSNIILQHQPNREAIEFYIEELVRVLKPFGLLVFQLPFWISWVYRFHLRRRLYLFLKRLGCSDHFLHNNLNLTTIKMTFIPIEGVLRVLANCQANVLRVGKTSAGPVKDAVYFVSKGDSV